MSSPWRRPLRRLYLLTYYRATTAMDMIRLFSLSATLLWLLAAAPLRAAPSHWTVELADPERAGRIVTANIFGPSGALESCPVVIIGHATITHWDHYRYLADPLAESGWLVALPSTEMGMPGDQAAFADDMLFLAEALSDGHPDLPAGVPAAQEQSWAMVGHSLGGGAAVLAAADDARVGALALLAPQDRARPSMIQRAPMVQAPTLILAGEMDCMMTPPLQHQWPLFSSLVSPVRAMGVLHGGGHCAFAGTPEPCTSAEMECGPTMAPSAQQELTLSLVLPWLDWRLRGRAEAGPVFLAAAQQNAIEMEQVGLPTAVSLSPITRLVALGPGPGSGLSRWRLQGPGTMRIRAAIYDLRGRLVKRLMVTEPGSDSVELVWSGLDGSGRPVAGGVYLLRVQVGDQVLRSRTVRLE